MKPGFQIEFNKTLFNEFQSNTFNNVEEKLFNPKLDSPTLFIENNRLKSINKNQSKEIIELNNKIKSLTSEISRVNSINKRLEFEKNQLSELNEPRNYKVYIHIMTGLWIYIGQTGQDLKERWQNGEGYKQHNQMLYHQIKKYGWENINHILYKDNLTKKEADIIERDLIHFYAKNEMATGLMVLNLAHNNL